MKMNLKDSLKKMSLNEKRDLLKALVVDMKSLTEVDSVLQEKKNWIAGAIKKPGALKATAKTAGKVNAKGNIKQDWLKSKAKGNSKTAKRARLAITLKKLRKEDAVLFELLKDSLNG